MRCVIATIAFMLTTIASAESQTISGRVVDADNNSRVRAAEIMIVQIDSSARTITDSAGAFRFRAIPGMWTFRVRALGYNDLVTPPLQLGEKEHISVVVLMSAQPLALAPLTVVARSNRALSQLEAFNSRRRNNAFGYFLDEKAIERKGAFNVSDLLRTAPGVRVERDRVQMRGCPDAQYLLDGLPVTPLGEETATEAINAMISPSDIAGIEVYRGDAAVPVELAVAFRGATAGACGVVAIWTKR
jgi:hypothetical protein